MTEEEKDIERKIKKEVSQDLIEKRDWIKCTYSSIFGMDPRIEEYIFNVIDNPAGHNLYELLSIKRFFYLVDKYSFNPKKVKKFIKFYELLRFSGIYGRRSYKLTPVQVFQYSNIYGIVDEAGYRVIRTVYLFVPRKFSKTTSTAAIAIFDMLFGDNNAQSYICSNSYDQAKILFDEIRAIMKDIDPREKHFRVNREKISFKDKGRDSFIQCLSANAKTKDGLNASIGIFDEYAQARNTESKNGADLKNVVVSSMGVREQPLSIVITTASEVVDGPCEQEIDSAKKILRGEMDSDKVFAHLFMPDVDDIEDDPNTWRKVQPHLGVTVRENYYQEAYQDAQMSAENMLTFRTKLLNMFVENEQKCWIPARLAKEVSRHLDIENITGYPDGMLSIDLSEKDDFSAVTVGLYNNNSKSFFFHTTYFLPEGSIETHRNKALYKKWIEAGHLILTPGNVIDYITIVNFILAVNKRVRILQIGYDPFKANDLINMLAASGAANILKPLKQTNGFYNGAVESFEHGIHTDRIHINDNPINYFCFGNAILDIDNMDNKRPVKKKQNMKIDGLITMLMAMRLFIDYER